MSDDRTHELLDEIAKLVALAIRQGADDTTNLILSLSKMGFQDARIAELMGTTSSAVRGIRHRAAKKTATGGAS